VKALIIIPAFNEEQSLKNLLPELMGYRSAFDLLLMDDGSTDGTAAIISSHQIPAIKLHHGGIGAAMHTGFLYALNHGYEIVVQMDGDGQHNPIFLHEVIKPIVDGRADLVIGSRYIKTNPDRLYQTPFLRRIGMYYSSIMLFLATGMYITDTTSGFRALSHKALKFFEFNYPSKYPEAGALFSLFLADLKIVEIPIKMRGRKSGKSMYNFFRIFFYPIHILIGFIRIYFHKIKE
jgi:glycosyltransferase involved in cell wall biosynthesis